jgi:hypothetical protein
MTVVIPIQRCALYAQATVWGVLTYTTFREIFRWLAFIIPTDFYCSILSCVTAPVSEPGPFWKLVQWACVHQETTNILQELTRGDWLIRNETTGWPPPPKVSGLQQIHIFFRSGAQGRREQPMKQTLLVWERPRTGLNSSKAQCLLLVEACFQAS